MTRWRKKVTYSLEMMGNYKDDNEDDEKISDRYARNVTK